MTETESTSSENVESPKTVFNLEEPTQSFDGTGKEEENKEEESGWWLTTRRIAGWFSTLLMVLLLVFAWPLAWGGVFSYTVVAGHSMEPKYHTGDLVMTLKRSEYKVGEIIVYTVTFGGKTGAIVHRVVEKLPDGSYKTKGDNNDFVDPWVAKPDTIRGEVIAMFPQAYRVIGIIRSPIFWIIPIGIMVTYFLWPAPEPKVAEALDENGEDENGEGDGEDKKDEDENVPANEGGEAENVGSDEASLDEIEESGFTPLTLPTESS